MRAHELSLVLCTILAAASGCDGSDKAAVTATSTSTSTSTVTGGDTSTALATGIQSSTSLATNSATATTMGITTSTGATTSSGSSTVLATGSGTGSKTSGSTATKTSSSTATATGGTGTCNYPACASKLFTNCVPDSCAGACVTQQGYMCGTTACPTPLTVVPTSMFSNLCYANGVKSLTTIDMSNPASMTAFTTVTKNGVVCYSYEMPYSQASATGITMILKDASGATVGTYVINSTNRTATITCTGGSPVVVSLDCISEQSTTSDCPACTEGTCS